MKPLQCYLTSDEISGRAHHFYSFAHRFFVHGLYTVLYGTINTGTNMMTVPRLFEPSLPQDKVE